MFERTDTIDNPHEHEVVVCFEPWGMSHQLSPGKSFTLVITSDAEGDLEIDRTENTVTVYAFPTATLKVYLDSELVEDFNNKIPEIPPNMTTKGFVSFMFGKRDE